jgi:hypothetical protein
MNYQEIFRQALDQIKSKWELPTTGFLAGGAISNVVWNILKDKDAPVNDLDIYHLSELKKTISTREMREKQHFTKNEKWVYEDYTGLNVGYQQKGYYMIEKVSVNGIFNIIEYKSSTEDKSIIIESFDINCCQLGYDIDKDEFVWTKDFETFLETGELRLANLTSPAHSALRLVKKKNDLDAILPEIELDVITYAMKNIRFIDSQKFRFKERYANMYKKYESELSKYFKLVRDKDVEEYLRNNLGVSDFIWTLEAKSVNLDIKRGDLPGVMLSKDFLFYVREIWGKIDYEKIWCRLHPIMDSYMSIKDYIDVELDEEKMDRLHKLVVHAPNTTKNLKGLSVSKQLDLFDNVLKAFPNDPFLAISVLEHYIVKEHDLNDDMELLLMELSIRKQILEDTKDKVYHVLGIETWHKKIVNDNPDFFQDF